MNYGPCICTKANTEYLMSVRQNNSQREESMLIRLKWHTSYIKHYIHVLKGMYGRVNRQRGVAMLQINQLKKPFMMFRC